MPRARSAWLVTLALTLAVTSAGAGPHANGVLLFHLNPDIEYTTTTISYEGESDLNDCREAVCEGSVIADRAQVWFVIASFAKSPGPVNLAGAEFGFANFNARDISFTGYGACNQDAGYEIPTDRWPGPREGTSITFTTAPRHEELVELYWFATYVYDAVSIELTVRPLTETAMFSDPNIPQALDDVVDFGILGFGEPGYNPCATSGPASGACCIWGQCRITQRDACESQGGIYQGDNTDCFPDPCTHDEIETTWGLLKRMYE